MKNQMIGDQHGIYKQTEHGEDVCECGWIGFDGEEHCEVWNR